MSNSKNRALTVGEEVANAITHGLGVLFILVASPILIMSAFSHGGARAVVGTSVFVTTALILYLASTIYHAIRPGDTKQTFQTIDHIAIFLLIAGTYTPFTLMTLQGAWGWSLFGVVWGLAALGVTGELWGTFKSNLFSTPLYLAMGWIVVIAAVPLVQRVPVPGLLLLLAGGLSYTVGVIFYALDHLPYYHAIWHVFVLGGTTFHFFAIMHYA